MDSLTIVFPRRTLFRQLSRIGGIGLFVALISNAVGHRPVASMSVPVILVLALTAVWGLFMALQRAHLTPAGVRSGLRPFGRLVPWAEVTDVFEKVPERGPRGVYLRLRSGKERLVVPLMDNSGRRNDPRYEERRDQALAHWHRVRGAADAPLTPTSAAPGSAR